MKCTNCGFDAENNPVCPICGYQLAPNPPRPRYDQAPPQTYAAPFQGDQTGAAPQQPVNQPYARQPYNQPPADPRQPVNQPYARQPYNQPPADPRQFPGQAAPRNDTGSAQQTNAPHQSVPPKKSNAGFIVLICVVGTVILAGVFLAIFSGLIFHSTESFAEKIKNSAGSAADSPVYDYYEPETEDPFDLSKDPAHKVGETVDLSERGSVSVTKLRKSATQPEFDEGTTGYDITVEYKNTTDKYVSFDDLTVNYYSEAGEALEFKYDDSGSDPYLVTLYIDNSSNYFEKIKPGESASEVIHIAVKNEIEKMYVSFENYSYENGGSERAVFEADLKNAK